MKRILITGVTGQDGALLAELLISSGEKNVFGIFRRGDNNKDWRLAEMGIDKQIKLKECDLNDSLLLYSLLEEIKPDIVFHLAGYSYVGDSFKNPTKSINGNLMPLINILECMRRINPEAWIFTTSSSEIYAGNPNQIISESSPASPLSPYGLAKHAGMQMGNVYRNAYNMKVCCGILFNHESEYRSRSFVTRKITYNLAKRVLNPSLPPFALGNLDTSRDWSYAGDFVEAFYQLSQKECSSDFIFASGVLTSLRDFIKASGKALDIEISFEGKGINEKVIESCSGRIICEVSSDYYRVVDSEGKVGDCSKLKSDINWHGSREVKDTVNAMINKDLKRLHE